MDNDRTKADPKEPHAFVGRLNVPFAAPKGGFPSVETIEIPVQRSAAPTECAVCGKPLDNRIHEAASEVAAEEDAHWPV